MNIDVLQFIGIALLVGWIIGYANAAKHYRHKIEVKEAEEHGKWKERNRLPPPSPDEVFRDRIKSLHYYPLLESYSIKANGNTYEYEKGKDE